MKKFIVALTVIGIFWWGFSISSANSSSCKEVTFANSVKACVNIEKVGWNRRELTADLTNGWSLQYLRCNVMTPDDMLYKYSIGWCNGEFTYDGNEAWMTKIWIRYNEDPPTSWEDKPSNSSDWTYPQRSYDFNNGGWGNNWYYDNTNNNNYYSNGNLSNFLVTTNDSSPSTYQYVNLNISARNSSNATITDFSDTVNFKVYYGHANTSSWTQTTSSSYYTMSSDYNTYGYDFSSYDHGYISLSNFIQFKNSSYDYKVRVYDANNSSIYKEIIFYVNGNNSSYSNSNLSNFYITTDDTTPTLNQYIDLTVKARDSSNYTVSNYTDSINFKVYYKASTSSVWTQTTSSSYYTMSYLYTNGYDFSSSDYGIAQLTSFIRFNKNNYQYKVRVYAENNTSIYKEITFTVGSSSSYSNINGFTSAQLSTVQSIYDRWNDVITALESSYPILRNSTTRHTKSNNLNIAMGEIINNSYNKTYSTYNEFYTAYLSWYNYTISIR